MKKIPFLLFLVLMIAACVTPEKLMYKGDYEGALRLTVRHLVRNKKSDKDIIFLESIFTKAQTRDLDRIEALKREGQPSSWEEITRLYGAIKTRQSLIERLLPLPIASQNRAAVFKMQSVDDLLSDSRKNAANYLYARAEKNITNSKTNNDKLSAREAYADLMRIDAYFKDFRDKESLKKEAHALGESLVFFRMINNANTVMPADFEREMLALGVRDMDSEWLKFTSVYNDNTRYDYSVYMNIQGVNVSPEQQREREYTDERDVQTGTEPVLDGRGKPKRDSLGKAITRPIFQHVRATVLEVQQQKTAQIGGTLEFYVGNSSRRNDLLKSVPIAAEAAFQNYAATFRGDREALSPESMQKIGNRPLPFPSTPDLLMTAADRLKPIVKQAIADNRGAMESRKP